MSDFIPGTAGSDQLDWIRQTIRYLSVVVISAVLEALSDQNDNLTLPLYMWSMLVLVLL